MSVLPKLIPQMLQRPPKKMNNMRKLLITFTFLIILTYNSRAQIYFSDTSRKLVYKPYNSNHFLLLIDKERGNLSDGQYIIFFGNDTSKIKTIFEIKNSMIDGFYSEFNKGGVIVQLILFKEDYPYKIIISY
jgi:hypothetical protein